MLYSKYILTISALCICLLVLSYCVGKSEENFKPRGKTYAGAAACTQCHKAQADSVLLTAHQWASMKGSSHTVYRSPVKGDNSLSFSGNKTVAIEANGEQVFQTLYTNGEHIESYPVDMVFGIRKAQTFLYWKGNNAFELPVSFYHSANKAGTSPGYSLLFPEFTRLIGKNCFECHSSYIEGFTSGNDRASKELMDKKTVVYGIDCEACHGPAADHVKYQAEHPNEKTAKFITTSIQLNPRQQLDRCGICHSGNDQEKLKPRFLFKPGDMLSDYFKQAKDSLYVDVHGNQLGLLAKSKCFKTDGTLNCSTCHSGHSATGGSPAFYSQKCMGCHTSATHNFCTATAPTGTRLEDNCIDCHMPVQPSEVINFYVTGSSTPFSMLYRSHRIAVYENKKKHAD